MEVTQHGQEAHGHDISARLNWLRAGVLGANDGIVSVAGLVVGVAGATQDRTAILTAGVAGVVAGALSMAGGEFVSVSTQRDTEKAMIELERWELETLPDHELAELALGLPDELKLSGKTGKVALREAFAADLPAEILARGKAGFGVPLGRWFREDLRELAADLLLGATATRRGLFRREGVAGLLDDHAAGRRDHGERIWALVMLELWLERYGDGDTSPAS